jgi:plasmid maintenance system antidote protein VapI
MSSKNSKIIEKRKHHSVTPEIEIKVKQRLVELDRTLNDMASEIKVSLTHLSQVIRGLSINQETQRRVEAYLGIAVWE